MLVHVKREGEREREWEFILRERERERERGRFFLPLHDFSLSLSLSLSLPLLPIYLSFWFHDKVCDSFPIFSVSLSVPESTSFLRHEKVRESN